jgi:hydrogenase maturation factor
MCLTLPVKVIKKSGMVLTVQDGARSRQINGALLAKCKVGDWVLANADLALNKISALEAKKINQLIATGYGKKSCGQK